MNRPQQKLTCFICNSQMSEFIDKISDDRYGHPGVFSIQQCPSCGVMSTTPPLREEDLPSLYGDYYPRKEVDRDALAQEAEDVKASMASLRRWIKGVDNQGHYSAKQGQKVLDIGAGSLLSLLETKAMGIEVYGVETDPNVKPIAEHFGLNVHIGNIYDHPFDGVSFDLIVLNQVIEHVPEPRLLLDTVKQRLTENGRVILAFPNTGSIYRRLFGTKWINWHIPFHQNHFNVKSFKQLARSAGYDIGRTRTITPNLWTLLQLRTIGQKPNVGQSSEVWSQSSAAPTKPSLARRIKNKALSATLKIGNFGMAIFNRLIDAMGYGDSILIVLTPGKTNK